MISEVAGGREKLHKEELYSLSIFIRKFEQVLEKA
jgi:hypothetical protein